jgi:ribonuclease HI
LPSIEIIVSEILMTGRGKIQIVTDGSCRPNPGPAVIGYGIYDEHGNPLEERTEYIGYATNNEAEYKAIIAALDCATGYCRGDVEHFTDSELVVKQLNGQYRVRAQHLKPLIEEIFTKRQYFQSVIHLHLPRTNPKIQRIDDLVNQKLDEVGV